MQQCKRTKEKKVPECEFLRMLFEGRDTEAELRYQDLEKDATRMLQITDTEAELPISST